MAIYVNNDYTSLVQLCHGELTSYKSEEILKLKRNAFNGIPMKYIDLPNLVTSKDHEALFAHCHELRYVNLPLVTELGNDSFTENYNLKTVNLGDITYLGEHCFHNASRLKRLPWLESVETITYNAFLHCRELREAPLKNLKLLKNQALADCPKLRKVWLPSTCEIEEHPFVEWNYENREMIIYTDASEPQPSWSSEWNRVGPDDERAMVKWNATFEDYEKDSARDEDVIFKGIIEGTIAYLEYPEDIIIHNNAFYKCNLLTEVYFPKLKTADTFSFNGCPLEGSFRDMFPQVNNVERCAFQSTRFSDIDLTNVQKIADWSFNLDSYECKVWLPSTCSQVEERALCCSNLTIYTDATESLENWHSNMDGRNQETVRYNSTYEEYLKA